MICTSRHSKLLEERYKTYAISGNRGRYANYEKDCFPPLAPKLAFWKEWHDNIQKVDEIDNNKFYIREYYKEVLSKLNPEEVYNLLDNSILLCYERNDEFCHRHIVASWFELELGISTPEVKMIDGKLEVVERPEYIKKYLEEVIKLDENNQKQLVKKI